MHISLLHYYNNLPVILNVLFICDTAMGDLFDPFGMGSGSGVGSSVASSRQASGPDLFGDLLGSDSSATSGFSSAYSNPTTNTNTSLFNLSEYIIHVSTSAASASLQRNDKQCLVLSLNR